MENKEWHEWRRNGIGASDAPIIMGVSPWKTRYKLWSEKVGLVQPEQGNWATQRGHDLEPVARAQYELESGLNFPIKFLVHPDYDWMRASLDGFNEEKKIILEIKCPGKDDHQKAVNGEVPEKYIPQLQHQLMVAEASAVHYVSFDGSTTAMVEVFPDIDYQKKLFKEEEAFWNQVKNKLEPERTNKDYTPVTDKELLILLKTYRDLSERLEEIEKNMESVKKTILDNDFIKKNDTVFGEGVAVQRIQRKGAINYAQVPEIKGVDLEKYRKPDSTFYQLRLTKRL